MQDKGVGSLSEWERSSTARVLPPAQPRKLAKVPFVELHDGRIQGVVSSGSDLGRVYVSYVEAGSLAYSCRTNNNRPCGGALGTYCKHILTMLKEAVLQYGSERVGQYLGLDPAEEVTETEFVRALNSGDCLALAENAVSASVFSRFLRQLAYLELPVTTTPSPELHWFLPTRAVA